MRISDWSSDVCSSDLLLQWTPAAQATIGPDPTVGAYYRWMAGAVVTGAVAIAGTWLFGDRTVYLATPVALLWIASPAVARWVSRPSSAVVEHAANADDRRSEEHTLNSSH